MATFIGSISVNEVRKQINKANIKALAQYQQLLEWENNSYLNRFLKSAETYKVALKGEVFTVYSKILSLNLITQCYPKYLVEAINDNSLESESKYGVRYDWLCTLSDSGEEIEFLLDD